MAFSTAACAFSRAAPPLDFAAPPLDFPAPPPVFAAAPAAAPTLLSFRCVFGDGVDFRTDKVDAEVCWGDVADDADAADEVLSTTPLFISRANDLRWEKVDFMASTPPLMTSYWELDEEEEEEAGAASR